MTLKFSLVSPEKTLFEQDVSMVVVPGSEGDIGILPNHAPLLTLLRPGVVSVYEGDKIFLKFFVDGGFCEVTPERCMALVTTGSLFEALNKAALELEIKQLLDERENGHTPGEQEKMAKSLKIARAKLMEIVAHQKIQ